MYLFSVLLLLLTSVACPVNAKIVLNGLRVDMRENPAGISSGEPRFMWRISSSVPDLVQESYRIEVADSPQKLKKGKNLLWNSGEVRSDNSVFIPYKGQKLASRKTYYWRVKIKTNQGETAWSKINTFSTALDASGWKASWIGENRLANPGEKDKDGATRLAARYLRKEFRAGKKIKRAVLYISGLGSSESYLNGKRISDDVFASLPSLYSETTYYNTYDVSDLVRKGNNTLGVMLGNGRFFAMRNPGVLGFGLPRLLAQLEIEYADGETETILSDASWKVTSRGPIVANNEFDGEEYDARLELAGWNGNGYDDGQWKQADLMESPGGKLLPQPSPNLKVMEEIRPIEIKPLADGKYLLDMGQNMVGWLHVALKGKAGQPVTLRFAESLKDDGTIYTANLRSAKATDIYTPAKDGDFSWEPSFVYHGFRFVEISGLDHQPGLDAFTGKVIYDEMSTSGQFETSNALVNQLYKNAYWGIRGNYRGMPTDCPQRDERLGWLGDRATGAYGESFIFENNLLYNKWLQDIEDSQLESGSISDVSPKHWAIYADDVTWPSAYFYVADMLYRQFGDKRGIETHYASMRKWIRHIRETSLKDYIITKDQYGDWCMPPESQELIHSQDPARKTDGSILGTTVYYDLLRLMEQFAVLTGNENDCKEYRDLARQIKEAYNKRFFDEKTARYGNNTVTGNLLSLMLGLVPEGYEEKVFENILRKTEVDFNGHISTGVLGIQYLMRGLTQYGAADLAYRLTTNDTYPSWGYMIKKGATTIWELWNGDTADPAMNSANHVMLLGDLIIWYYENLGGIQCDPQSAGYKKIRMKPVFPKGLDHVNASYDSVHGKIKSAWKRSDGHFSWNVTIPGNTSATLILPADIRIDKTKQPGIRNISEKDGCTYIEVGSGDYTFQTR